MSLIADQFRHLLEKRLALRPREAATALSISARTLWGLTAPRGPIPCLRIGHGKRQTVLYPVTELRAWLNREAKAGKDQVLETDSNGNADAVGRLRSGTKETRRHFDSELSAFAENIEKVIAAEFESGTCDPVALLLDLRDPLAQRIGAELYGDTEMFDGDGGVQVLHSAIPASLARFTLKKHSPSLLEPVDEIVEGGGVPLVIVWGSQRRVTALAEFADVLHQERLGRQAEAEKGGHDDAR